MGILKKTMLASIGAIELTREKAEQVIDDLIKRGELDQSSRKEAILELLGKAEQSASQFGARVTEAAKELKPAKEQDLRKLEDRLNQLARRVEKLQEQFDAAKDQSKT